MKDKNRKDGYVIKKTHIIKLNKLYEKIKKQENEQTNNK